MRPRIPEPTRWIVVEKWMLGYPRNTIAIDCGLSNGAVTSIVDAWRQAKGLELADLIRAIGVSLRKLGMTPAQCATGFRIHSMIGRIGLDENSIESFLSSVYTNCQEVGVNPNHISKYIYELSSLLESERHSEKAVSLQDIDAIFERRKQVKNELEQETQQLQSTNQKLLIETALCKKDLQELAEKKSRLQAEISWNWNLKEQIKEHGFTAGDPSKVLYAARFLRDNHLSLEEMVMKFSNVKGMDNYVSGQQLQIENMQQRYRSLEQATQDQIEQLEERRLKNKELEELKEMGVGLRHLKILKGLITEVATEEKGSQGTEENGQAMKDFISDIENYYDDYLHLRRKVGKLKADVELFRGLLIAMGPLGPTISSFFSRRPTIDEIEKMIKMIEDFRVVKSDYKSDSSSSSSSSSPSPSSNGLNNDQVHPEPNKHEDVHRRVEADSNQLEREKYLVTVSQELVHRGDKVEYKNNEQNYPGPNYTESPAITSNSSLSPKTRSNQEGDTVGIQPEADDNRANSSVKHQENLLMGYGLPLIPRSSSDKHPEVIIPGTNTSSLHYHDSHTPMKARKKHLYPPAITKAKSAAAYDKAEDIEDGKKFAPDKDYNRKNEEVASSAKESVTAVISVSQQVPGKPSSAYPIIESNPDVKSHDSVQKEPPELDLHGGGLIAGDMEGSSRCDDREEPESVDDYDQAESLSELLQCLYRRSGNSQDLLPPPPNFISTDLVKKKSSSEDYSKNAPTISGSKFAEGNTESAAYHDTKWNTRGEKRVSTVHTDDECFCVSVPYRKIMDQEKNLLLSTREDPTTRFKRQMQAFHKRAKHDIAKLASNKGQKNPSSEVQTRKPEEIHNLNMTNKSKGSTIHEQK
jgi:hypothetical protein